MSNIQSSSGLFRRERGEGRFGTMIGLLVLATTVYIGFKTIPVLVRGYEFRDFLEEQARFAAMRSDDDDVRKAVIRKAQELELPVQGKDIKLLRTSNRYDIAVRYTVPIETPVYTYDWIFDEKQSSPLF